MRREGWRTPWRRVLGLVSLLVLTAAGGSALPLEPGAADSAHIQLALERASTPGTVLYIGAHPDDENTAALAALALGRGVRTVYLSLTRGAGGQNLIGSQQGDALGVIRTQELLAARAVDHAEQRFTRAIDFGYCKSPEEALRLWGHDEVLADVVWTIRDLRPDVIIMRFTSAGGGHGHHTASARLAEEAFAAAADPTRFPEQLQWVAPWQAHRLVWNRYSWGRPPATKPEHDSDAWVDVGAYRPLLGRSFAELAAMSRSMHKSQAMGTSASRGQRLDWFEHVAGHPAANGNLFDGIDTSWSRFPGGEAVAQHLTHAAETFDSRRPERTVPDLVAAWRRLGEMGATTPRDGRIDHARESLLTLIRDCAALWIEAVADRPTCVPGSRVRIETQIVKRSEAPLRLSAVTMVAPPLEHPVGQPLENGTPASQTLDVVIPEDAEPSQPHWMTADPDGFLRPLSPPPLRDRADTPAPLSATFVLEAEDGTSLPFVVPVLYRSVDPVEGERYQTLSIVPAASVRLAEPVIVAWRGMPRAVHVTTTSHADAVEGDVALELPRGWSSEPARRPFSLARAGDTITHDFAVRVENGIESGPIQAVAHVGQRALRSAATTLDFPHFPPQAILEPARAPLLRLAGSSLDLRVGYVMGSGDAVPDALSELGCTVVSLSDEDLLAGDLDRLDAIVAGVRAYNTRDVLAKAHDRLMAYVERGGRLVVQYNTTQKLVTEDIGPYPFRLSRDRVSVETVPVTITMPSHPLLQAPYGITAADFEGWVQERGLYFPGDWDERYDAPLACADPGEASRAGGLLVARYGRGRFAYVSYSLFRQLPAGVPGAYRLLANLVAGDDGPRDAGH